MPRKAQELSALAVKRLVSPGLFAVGGITGLALQVKESGARSWVLRITGAAGKRQEIGLGGYPDISLSAARELAARLREQVAGGADPVEERRQKRSAAKSRQLALTFDQAADRWHSIRVREYRNAKHAAQVITTLRTYASPTMGTVPVREVDLRHVLSALEPIWLAKTETADRLRGRIESVLSWATAAGYRNGENPARWRGNLDALLPRPGKISRVDHHRALPVQDMSAFYADLQKSLGTGARALEFLILTAARSGEVRGAVWSEIDLKAGVWTVPAERMKAKREHRVPLSRPALKILKELPQFAGSELVFPSRSGKQLSDMTLSAVLRRMQAGAVPHGFRSTFRDWAAERTSYPSEMAEMALAHTIGNKVEAAYRRGDLFEKRRNMMEDWGNLCLGVR